MEIAKRGDLAVYEVETSYTTTTHGHQRAIEYCVGVVTSVKRDGSVKAIRDSYGSTRLVADILGWRRCWLVSPAVVDVAKAVAAAHANPWNDEHPTGKPFDSLDDLRAVIVRHKIAA